MPTEHSGIPLTAAIEKTVRGFERVFPSSIHIRRDLVADCDVAMSADSFERVLLNLGMNARDAMSTGGELSIRTKLAEGQDLGNVLIEVADTGAGMGREAREHMFDPFFTTKGDGEGTGLGLTTVYRLVTGAGGRITVDSEQGRGTTFRLVLPTAEARSRTPEPRQIRETEMSSLKICVVEDDPSVRRVIVRVLRSEGHEVVQAKNGDEAVACVAEATELDVLLTDAGLPGASVAEVIEQFRARHPKGRVLVCSGHEEGWLARKTEASGDYVFLHKPFRPEELLAALRQP
jgi:CheY-like chemotaxis protein